MRANEKELRLALLDAKEALCRLTWSVKGQRNLTIVNVALSRCREVLRRGGLDPDARSEQERVAEEAVKP